MHKNLGAYGNIISKFIDFIIVSFTILIVGSIILSHFSGDPVFVSYTMSDSMEPTIGSGDMFFIVPQQLHTPVKNDILIFKNPENGLFIVHRIIDKSEEGYITKGDNSIFFDQQADTPVIKDSDVIGTVLSPLGRNIIIPNAGKMLSNISFAVNQWYLYMVAALILFGSLSFRKSSRFRKRVKPQIKIRHVLVVCTVIVIIWSTLMLVLSAQNYKNTYVTNNRPFDESEIAPGQTFEDTYIIKSIGFFPTIVFISPDSDNLELDTDKVQLSWGDTYEGKMTIKAPESSGRFITEINTQSYPLFMPSDVIESLYKIHMAMPIIIIEMILLMPLFIYYALFCNGNEYVSRSFRRISWKKRIKISMGVFR